MAAFAMGGITSCDKWTETEPVEQKPARPVEQDPALWAGYTAALREYKKSDHTVVFAGFDNGTTNATSEKDFLRSLPDSLDIVSLTNADNFSKYDAEDMAVMREKGTKVVYLVDYASRSAEFADLAALGAYLDKVVARVAELGLDGLSFSGVPVYGSDAEQTAQKAVAALFIEKFAAVAGPGKDLVLLFEGDPQFLTPADRAKIDWFVLDTKFTNDATNLKMQVLRALGASAVPREKLLLGTMTEFEFIDERKAGSNAIPALTLRVPELGPLAGLCIYNVNQDYFGSEMIYSLTRGSIQTLNPSK
jgi:hypothetical protein